MLHFDPGSEYYTWGFSDPHFEILKINFFHSVQMAPKSLFPVMMWLPKPVTMDSMTIFLLHPTGIIQTTKCKLALIKLK